MENSSNRFIKPEDSRIRVPNSSDIHASEELLTLSEETLVCADLLKHGFVVFRAVSEKPSFNLMAALGRKNWRIKTQKAKAVGSHRVLSSGADILAVVRPDGSIEYFEMPDFKPFNPYLKNFRSKENAEIWREKEDCPCPKK